MKSFAGIGAKMERAMAESASDRIKNFRLELYTNKWQPLREILFAFMPKSKKTKNTHKKVNEEILVTICHYRPLLEEQYRKFQENFYKYERYINAWGEDWYEKEAAARGEEESISEIDRLTGEFQSKLNKIGWKYLPIATREKLITGYTGHQYIDNALKYFELLEKHFEAEVASFS